MTQEQKMQWITKQNQQGSHFYLYFCQKIEFRTYFAYFHKFSYKIKVLRTPTVWAACAERGIQQTDITKSLSASAITNIILASEWSLWFLCAGVGNRNLPRDSHKNMLMIGGKIASVHIKCCALLRSSP